MVSLLLKRRSPITFLLIVLFALLPLSKRDKLYAQEAKMLIRISEIEIYNQHLKEYRRILNEEAEASVRLEPGVLCIFPIAQKDKPTRIRILEVYASRDAYDTHIKSAHFQKYKNLTLAMVKSLSLVDMEPLEAEMMPLIFKKMNERPSAPNTIQP